MTNVMKQVVGEGSSHEFLTGSSTFVDTPRDFERDRTGPASEVRARSKLVELTPEEQVRFLDRVVSVVLIGQPCADAALNRLVRKTQLTDEIFLIVINIVIGIKKQTFVHEQRPS